MLNNLGLQYTRQMLITSWGKPEVYHHAVVKKHSACRVTASVQRALNRIETALQRWSCTCTFLIYPGVSLASKSILPSSQSLLSIHQNTIWFQIFVGEKFRIKPFNLRINFRDKIFVKNQIDTSYYVDNIRQQNEFIFHMHTKWLQNIQSSQLTSYLVDLHSYSYRCTEDIA